ncbi:thioredoxin-like protein [Coleophoma crateriformis]|uniref:Thioredoxin-like protein n=1 Tax=Coleophoma crateriformis TaxID=565419 RepID=A0A3D8S9X8_9HELO|nr:thioredoxin-like protein [Coleophoma crateriformis]
MTVQQELASWMSPPALNVSPVPEIGSEAPSSSALPLPNPNNKPTIVTFLRHCGCPFAEKTFKDLCAFANKHPEVNFTAVSHSDQASTDHWLESVGGKDSVPVIVDHERTTYARWGLGTSSAWHILSPWALYNVYKLGMEEGIWNRPTETGSRWQETGSAAIDKDGIVRWFHKPKTADERPDFSEALNALGV